ncbi:Protein spire-like protein 1, partial [Nibea albiflora]
MLTSPTILRDFAADLNAGDVNMDCGEGSVGVSLEEILKLYSQPINEEQAWAVIDSLGVMIYKALDYGLKENEERELSPPL